MPAATLAQRQLPRVAHRCTRVVVSPALESSHQQPGISAHPRTCRPGARLHWLVLATLQRRGARTLAAPRITIAFGRREHERDHTVPVSCRAARALTRSACPFQALK